MTRICFLQKSDGRSGKQRSSANDTLSVEADGIMLEQKLYPFPPPPFPPPLQSSELNHLRGEAFGKSVDTASSLFSLAQVMLIEP